MIFQVYMHGDPWTNLRVVINFRHLPADNDDNMHTHTYLVSHIVYVWGMYQKWSTSNNVKKETYSLCRQKKNIAIEHESTTH